MIEGQEMEDRQFEGNGKTFLRQERISIRLNEKSWTDKRLESSVEKLVIAFTKRSLFK